MLFFLLISDTQSCTAFNNISTPEELMHYLKKEYKISNNMTFVQGLFLACGTKHLYDICLKYARSNKDKVIYFEEEIRRVGTKSIDLNHNYVYIV